MNAEVVDYRDNKQAVRLTLINGNYDKMRFLVFSNNMFLINKLLEITYGNFNVEVANERDFVGLEFLIWLEEKMGT